MRGIWLFSISSWGLNFALFSYTRNISVQSNAAEMNHVLQLQLQLKAHLNNWKSLRQVHKPSVSAGSEDTTRKNKELELRDGRTSDAGKLSVAKQAHR